MTLVWRPGFQFDADASTYIEAVEVADGQALETGVRYAINDFVIGCKQDGIWDAIKASCILAGARTTNGALVPLVGSAPTPYNFDLVGDTDYNRETGLKGDGSTKYLDSNRNNNADPQNSRHLSIHASSASTVKSYARLIASGNGASGSSFIVTSNTGGNYLAGSSSIQAIDAGVSDTATGFLCVNRNASTNLMFRANSVNRLLSNTSSTPVDENYRLYGRPGESPLRFANARLSFYSIGESLDLALLDTRVSNLMTAIGAAIP